MYRNSDAMSKFDGMTSCRPPDMSESFKIILSHFSTKTYVVSTQKNSLSDMGLFEHQKHTVQSFITLHLRSIGMDSVMSELCYIATILQRSYRKKVIFL